jgi:hypothetical protein
MPRTFRVSAFLLLVSAFAYSSDQQRAEKLSRRIAAFSVDATARSIVNRTMCDSFNVKRATLLQERRRMNVNYGSLFLAHEYMLAGATLDDIATRVKKGKSMLEIGQEQHADWKRIATDAKKFNTRIEDNIYKHFLNTKNTEADNVRDVEENYHVDFDWLNADQQVTNEEVVEAAQSFVFWRNHAGITGAADRKLGIAKENAAAINRSADRPGGSLQAPAAGGVPQN